MDRKRINYLIGYGILVFLLGFFAGTFWLNHFQWLILIGAGMTFTGIFFFFKKTDLWAEFAFNDGDDFLTYFWDTLALKIWTAIFALWMIVMVFNLLSTGQI
jgi:hypothetical protein